jgi:hypothetical protein
VPVPVKDEGAARPAEISTTLDQLEQGALQNHDPTASVLAMLGSQPDLAAGKVDVPPLERGRLAAAPGGEVGEGGQVREVRG